MLLFGDRLVRTQNNGKIYNKAHTHNKRFAQLPFGAASCLLPFSCGLCPADTSAPKTAIEQSASRWAQADKTHQHISLIC